MKLALFTQHFPNYQSLADLAVPNHEEYCIRHGYQHIVHQGAYANPNWYYGFQKIQYILDLFYDPAKVGATESPDLVWSLNLPSVITNMTIPVTEYLQDSNADFWITKDCHDINGGSLVVRKSEWSKRWLEFIIANEPIYKNHCWFEQKVMIDHWQNPEWKSRISILHQRLINSYVYQLYPPWNSGTIGDWRRGDLVLSFPGTNLEQRLKLVEETLRNRVIP